MVIMTTQTITLEAFAGLLANEALPPALSAGDADTLCQCAAGQGFYLDDQTRQASELAYRSVLNDIRREQE